MVIWILSIIREKPKSENQLKLIVNLKVKLMMLLNLLKKKLNLGNQIFWVCPLIEESKKIDHHLLLKNLNILNKIFPNQVSLLTW